MSVEVGRPTVLLTESAVAKLKEMLAEQDDPNLCFRVFIQPGGCDGFSYGMTFDSPEADDEVIERGGVRLLVDRTSARLLRGSEVDYVNSVTATGFAIRNPNAVATCGCGHSFKTADEAGHADPCGEEAEAGE
ncbi:MAG TPA: iron-sulfur cluster assembly accessory protein [bacterium]|jgi:iron-sulfur cluster assembly protein|nr:iron-sulfur cluster assembly accessory protein [bacterium]